MGTRVTMKTGSSVAGRLFLTLFLLMFFGAGLLFAWFIGREFLGTAKPYAWKETGCLILSSQAGERGWDNHGPFVVRIRYQYSWQEQAFESEKLFAKEKTFTDPGEPQRLAEKFKR